MTLRYARIFLSEAWVHSAGTHADPLFFFGISGDGCTSREKLPAVRTYDFFFLLTVHLIQLHIYHFGRNIIPGIHFN